MTPELKQDILTVLTFALQNEPTQEIQGFFDELAANVDGQSPDIDAVVIASFGIAVAIAEETPNAKDEGFIESLKELYINLKDPSTGFIADLKAFFQARREAKREAKS